MKTNTQVNLNWRHCSAEGNSYEAVAGPYTANVSGKHYEIFYFYEKDGNPLCFSLVFNAKARSNKDAFQRATNKLIKLALQDSTPNPFLMLAE